MVKYTKKIAKEKDEHMEKKNYKKGIQALYMMFLVWIVIECDFISAVLPNQILALGISPVIWGIGAFFILNKMRKQNAGELYQTNDIFTGRDWLIIFFVVMGSISLCVRNYVYIGMRPLIIREFFSSYPLYTLRNILYYPLEILLMLELLIYAQRAGDCLTQKSTIPWGALVLFFLWGLPHLYHGVTDGIVSALNAFIFAIPFYASGKKLKVSYISMLILWLLV